ncbi:hypothetical protein MUGA111182_06995 [Mucilaginibacter galii]
MLSNPQHSSPMLHNIRYRKSNLNQKQRNTIIAGDYRGILVEAKTLLKPTDGHAFELDFTRSRAKSKLALYAFITPTFYWYLECDPFTEYQVTYAFGNCPQEVAIRKLLSKFFVQEQLQEIKLQPDFDTYYRNVQQVQDRKHFYSLQG